MRQKKCVVFAISVFFLSACGPSDDDLMLSCVEIRETRGFDGSQRVQILRDAGVKGKDMETVILLVDIAFRPSKMTVERIARQRTLKKYPDGIEGCFEVLKDWT